jgi:methionyl aminopeptidase
MIIGKSRKELEKMRAAGRLAGQVREALRHMVRPGITTLELDAAAEKMIRAAGALPTFKGYHGFPYSICASVNEQIVHGFPSRYELQEGDIISIDVGATLDGFVGDTATTVPVGWVRPDWLAMIRVAEECLERAITECWPGRHLGDIGWAVQAHAEAHGYSIVREYVGHGIGRRMHEDPQIPNYGTPGKGTKIKSGYVFAIEPMLNMGTHHTKTLKDGWTVVTVDGQPSAHVEHTIAITEDGPEVFTRVEQEAAAPQPAEAAAHL